MLYSGLLDSETQLRLVDRDTQSEGVLGSPDGRLLEELNVKLAHTEKQLCSLQVEKERMERELMSEITTLKARTQQLPTCKDAGTQTTSRAAAWHPLQDFLDLKEQSDLALTQDVQTRLLQLEQEKSDKERDLLRLVDARDLELAHLSSKLAVTLDRHAVEEKTWTDRLSAKESELRECKEKLDSMAATVEAAAFAKKEALRRKDQELQERQLAVQKLEEKVLVLEGRLRSRLEELKETIKSLDALQRTVRGAPVPRPPSAVSTHASSSEGNKTPLLEIPEEFRDFTDASREQSPSGLSPKSGSVRAEPHCANNAKSFSGSSARSPVIGRGKEHCSAEETVHLSERVCILTATLLTKMHGLSLAEERVADLETQVKELSSKLHHLEQAKDEADRVNAELLQKQAVLRDRLRSLEASARALSNENDAAVEKIHRLELAEARLQDQCRAIREEHNIWRRQLEKVHEDHVSRAARERRDHGRLIGELKEMMVRFHGYSAVRCPTDEGGPASALSNFLPASSHPFGGSPMLATDAVCAASEARGVREFCPHRGGSDLLNAIQELTSVLREVADQGDLSKRNRCAEFAAHDMDRIARPAGSGDRGPMSAESSISYPSGTSCRPASSAPETPRGRGSREFSRRRGQDGILEEVAAGTVIPQLCDVFLSVGRRLMAVEHRAAFTEFTALLCYKQWQLQRAREADSIRDKNLLHQRVQALETQVRTASTESGPLS